MTTAEGKATSGPDVAFSASVLQRIRQHARSSMDAEICGVLLGHAEPDGRVVIDECIRGEGASQGGAHVTFTQDTWQHIYKEKDSRFPDHAIVGWYHSHPGFGIFLSDYDLFIHRNFFGAPHQVAWVFDPHSDEEGCFGWCGEAIQPLSRVAMQSHSRKATVGGRDEPSCTTPRNRNGAPGSWQRFQRFVIPGVTLLAGLLVGAALHAGYTALRPNQIPPWRHKLPKKVPISADAAPTVNRPGISQPPAGAKSSPRDDKGDAAPASPVDSAAERPPSPGNTPARSMPLDPPREFKPNEIED
jgi:proteasome lid subunit RPN8/RPN11